RSLECDTRSVRSRLRNQTARISLQIASMSKSRGKNKTEPPFPWRFRPYHLDHPPHPNNHRRFRFVSHRSASRCNYRRFGEGCSTDTNQPPQPPFSQIRHFSRTGSKTALFPWNLAACPARLTDRGGQDRGLKRPTRCPNGRAQAGIGGDDPASTPPPIPGSASEGGHRGQADQLERGRQGAVARHRKRPAPRQSHGAAAAPAHGAINA
ncbi:hypothetical protein C8J30_1281, partial [Rhodobacter viridis]